MFQSTLQEILSGTMSLTGMTVNPDAGFQMWTQIISILQAIVVGGGGMLSGFGIVKLFDGQGDGDGAKVSQGRWQVIGGVGLMVVGALIIPMLGDIFTV
ncbi:MAG: Maff2 family protein [Defluviitaleaceae bacterium]|nr:Maff2 family protein [Defluviitaleaceae bacterium]